MTKLFTYGLKLSLFNFVLVAVLGVLMRYKIAFPFDVFQQKFMQDAHSHFAFYGWISTVIYLLVLRDLYDKIKNLKSGKYFVLILINLFGAYGMLFSFLYGGYFWLSILFSTVCLVNSFVFFFFLFSDLRNVKTVWKKWYLAGLFFALVSSVGVFYMAYSMTTHQMSQQMYLGSTYYYLHFQYNGFFIFSCIGLLLGRLEKINVAISERENRVIFYTLFVGCILAFGLSVLWAKMPIWIYALVVLGSILQTFASGKLMVQIKKNWSEIQKHWSPFQRFILFYVGFAYVVKILLQLGSTIPEISKFAFGFRNIVIAYLHLVLLMCVATFLLGILLSSNYFKKSKAVKIGMILFLLGTFLNEFFLGINGILSIKYILLPHTQYILFGISVLIMISLMWIFLSLKSKQT